MINWNVTNEESRLIVEIARRTIKENPGNAPKPQGKEKELQMEKHTQDTWKLVELSEPTDDWVASSFVIRTDQAPGGIAVTVGGLGIEEEEANAHLILAAPDLFRALSLAIPALEAYYDKTRLEQPLLIARAAIAKALHQTFTAK